MSNLTKALETLREQGWIKYKLFNKQGAHCARGALMHAVTGNDDAIGMWDIWDTVSKEDRLLNEVARELFPDRYDGMEVGGDLICFNNHPDTTFEDVEQVFEKAILREQERI